MRTDRQESANSAPLAPGTDTPSEPKKPRAWKQNILHFDSDHGFDLALGACALTYLTVTLLWQYSRYAAGAFGYHDLTIISDFFSNGLVHGKPFLINDTQENHLKIHFTPSLILLMPLFALLNTQFALIALATIGVCLSIYIATREQHASLHELGVEPGWRWALSVTFFAAFAFNPYVLRNLSSAHFEPFFMPAATLLLCAIRRAARLWWLALALLIALGVRQDAGFFLFFLLVGCLFAPKRWSQISRRTLVTCAALCIVYFVFTARVVQPWLGNDGNTRFWHEWGNTWPQVFFTWLTSPVRVWHAVEASEFFRFNWELFWLPALSPLTWALNQAPGVLFYTANAADKRNLYFYNSAFLLPGMMLCLAFAQLHTISLVRRLTRNHLGYTRLSLCGLVALFACASIVPIFGTPEFEDESIRIGDLSRHDPFSISPLRRLVRCRNLHAVAADFNNIVFVPFRRDKFLLTKADKADLVVVPMHLEKRTPFYVKPKHLVRSLLQEGKYRRLAAMDGYELYLRDGVGCRIPADQKP